MAKASSTDLVCWDEVTLSAFVSSCAQLLTLQTCRDLERRARSGTGTEEKTNMFTHSHGDKESGGATSSMTSSCPFSDEEEEEEEDGKREIHIAQGRCNGKDGQHSLSTLSACQHDFHFQKDAGDLVGELLDNWVRPHMLRRIAATVAERSSQVMECVVLKAAADGVEFSTADEERLIRRDVLKEALIRELHTRVFEGLQTQQQMESKEGGLLANPGGYSEGPLDSLRPETIADLMHNGWAVQGLLMGDELRMAVLDECEYLDYDGRFDQVLQQHKDATRSDLIYWLNSNDLQRDKFQGLLKLFKKLHAIPFELNAKANLFLQAGGTFQLSYFPPSGSFYVKHMDGGYSAQRNNGRKITCVYFPNPHDWQAGDGGYERMYPRRNRQQQFEEASETEEVAARDLQACQELRPAGDILLLFRSRDIPHEVLRCHRKRFAVTFWITGPEGPGDDD